VNTWFVAKAAKEAGLKVAISGLGGDELLAGYPSFVDLPRWRRRFVRSRNCRGRTRGSRSAERARVRMVREHPKAPSMLEYAGAGGRISSAPRLYMPHELSAKLDRISSAKACAACSR